MSWIIEPSGEDYGKEPEKIKYKRDSVANCSRGNVLIKLIRGYI